MCYKFLLLLFLVILSNKAFCQDDIHALQALINGQITQYDYEKLDPNIKYNQKIMKFNMLFFRNSILPLLYLINAWTPKFVIRGYKNFSTNLREPRNYVMHLVNHDKKNAALSAKRFFINTIFGVFGIVDVAKLRFRYISHKISTDCAMRIKGMMPGEYMITPILNQNYQRKFASDMLDWTLNPAYYFVFPISAIYFTIEQFIDMLPKLDLLYANRKYSEEGYKNLRELTTSSIMNMDCVS